MMTMKTSILLFLAAIATTNNEASAGGIFDDPKKKTTTTTTTTTTTKGQDPRVTDNNGVGKYGKGQGNGPGNNGKFGAGSNGIFKTQSPSVSPSASVSPTHSAAPSASAEPSSSSIPTATSEPSHPPSTVVFFDGFEKSKTEFVDPDGGSTFWSVATVDLMASSGPDARGRELSSSTVAAASGDDDGVVRGEGLRKPRPAIKEEEEGGGEAAREDGSAAAGLGVVGRELETIALPTWSRTLEDSSQRSYSLKSPDLGAADGVSASVKYAQVALALDPSWALGCLSFKVKTEFNTSPGVTETLRVFSRQGLDTNPLGEDLTTNTDWKSYGYSFFDTPSEVVWEFLHSSNGGGAESGAVYLDEVKFKEGDFSCSFPTLNGVGNSGGCTSQASCCRAQCANTPSASFVCQNFGCSAVTLEQCDCCSVSSTESIASKVGNSMSGGTCAQGGTNGKAKFKLVGGRGPGEPDFEIDVVESAPAVTGATTVSADGDAANSWAVDPAKLDTVFVGDEGPGVFAVIGVNPITGRVNGIVEREAGEGKIQFTQNPGNSPGGPPPEATASDAEVFNPPPWSCDGSPSVRRLHEDDVHHHDHVHDHHHDHDHQDHNHQDDLLNLRDIVTFLKGSSNRPGDDSQRKLQMSTGYSYQVNLYLEVDYAFCQKQGEQTLGTATQNYINNIVAGANSVLEPEISVHLNVVHMTVNNNYDSATSVANALDLMRARYPPLSNGTPNPDWHYRGINLHHAILAKDLGGGIAYQGTVCIASAGFGVTTSAKGNYLSMGASAVWDMLLFLHEIGHSLGAKHASAYSVDACTKSTVCTSLTPPLPLAKSLTLMSDCHHCEAATQGISNYAYTYGGTYIAGGNRGQESGYSNTDTITSGLTTNGRKVNVEMYNRLTVLNSLYADCLIPS